MTANSTSATSTTNRPLAQANSELDQLMLQARKASEFLKALSHESRLLVLCLLAEKERTVSDLETLLALRQPTVSQQLARLRLDGLVAARRDGKAIYYSLADENVRQVISMLHRIFCPPGTEETPE